ncbi:MAG: 2,3,4,5-tetrahydropyridine-2,6-dicarboxylate N-succinyltransferase [Spirochaetia bacterium]|nr:2,3,4,5-tetrahydropyridine-2,6-dicarboxylate N-succinyltransferase [Spirochaetia bacterium]
MDNKNIENIISKAFDSVSKNPEIVKEKEVKDAVIEAIKLLDEGKIRVAAPSNDNAESWQVNIWVKQAILLYFRIAQMKVIQSGDITYWDKIPLKTNYDKIGVRVVPPALARYGSYIEPGAILMPSYVNIGAYVATGSMVDTWATVGSCAQIGKNVHLSGGVGIGGVLEPPQADPVIIEENAFLGSRCVVVEGIKVEKGAVLGSGVILTASTKIIDVTGKEPVTIKGKVPQNCVVIPGSIPKKFPAGEYQVPCALIIGKRKESTDLKTSLNDALRKFEVSV